MVHMTLVSMSPTMVFLWVSVCTCPCCHKGAAADDRIRLQGFLIDAVHAQLGRISVVHWSAARMFQKRAKLHPIFINQISKPIVSYRKINNKYLYQIVYYALKLYLYYSQCIWRWIAQIGKRMIARREAGTVKTTPLTFVYRGIVRACPRDLPAGDSHSA